MSRFAPVAPIHILEQLHKTDDLGNYHLVLTHDVLENRQRFTHLFRQAKYQYATIIVDNSVIELGHPVGLDKIRQAVAIFKRAVNNVVAVLPDELLNYDETCSIVGKSLKEWEASGDQTDLMFVPQGSTIREFIRCAEEFADCKQIKWIGIARNILQVTDSRSAAIIALQAIFPRAKFHLLGFSDDLCDDVICCRMPHVEGIDSAVPLRVMNIMSMADEEYPPRGNWWAEVKEVTPLMLQNLRMVRKWIEQRPDK